MVANARSVSISDLRMRHMRHQRETAPVKGLDVERRADMGRGPLEETPFEPLHLVRHGRARHTEIKVHLFHIESRCPAAEDEETKNGRGKK